MKKADGVAGGQRIVEETRRNEFVYTVPSRSGPSSRPPNAICTNKLYPGDNANHIMRPAERKALTHGNHETIRI